MMGEAEEGEIESKVSRKGPLAWFARNSVAANVLMIILVVGGFMNLRSIKQEVFPGFELDFVIVQLLYPGAGPEEVERGAILVTEEAIRGMDGIKEVKSTAREGFGVVSIALKNGEDTQQRLSEVKAAVDRITSFPKDMERPNIFLPDSKWEVISLVIYGPQEEKALRAMAEEMREELLRDDRVSSVDFGGAREYEISIEVSQENLRRYQLTLDQIAQMIRSSSVELPGGGVKTGRGEVLIRTTERRMVGTDFEEITLISRPDGTTLSVGDIAVVRDSFKDVDEITTYNDNPAVMMRVFRVGEEKPLDVAGAVKDLVAKKRPGLPPEVYLDTWMDMSLMYAQRMDLLTRNAMAGLILVILVLGLFLDLKLAFWVTLGIPISFIGAFLFLPSTDVSLNMISLFAFIQVLGMVVDDAIVVGEAAYLRRQQGMKPLDAAIAGVKEVAVPVCFAIITTIVMYIPMLMMPGVMGKFMGVIPVVVITVLLLSLVESLLILPAHLAHSRESDRSRGIFGWVARKQQVFSGHFERFVKKFYVPFIRWGIAHRYLTMSIALATLIASIGLLAGGRIRQVDMPDIDGEVVVCAAKLPYGTSLERAKIVEKALIDASDSIINQYGGAEEVIIGRYSQIGRHQMTAKQDLSGASAWNRGAHLIEVAVYMVPPAERSLLAVEMARQWRLALTEVVGLESISFSYAMGPGSGPAVHLNLSHPDYETLKVASAEMALRLADYEGTYDINDGYEEGKEQLDFELSPLARSLGVTEGSLALQLRAAFFGAEAVRQQRDRDEVRTYVRLPKSERESEYNIEEFMIRTPSGGEIPLAEAAIVKRGKAFTQIGRSDGVRVLSVTTMVDAGAADPKKINARVMQELVPEMLEKYPGLSYTTGGAEKEMAEANDGLIKGFMLALLGVFALLAVAFRSYLQPILIMLAIPFGFVGALWGHFVMGFDFSMMSMMGVVALSGVVVNDSLILIVAINENRNKGMELDDAITAGGHRRFRPILLTSLTTFFGLMPMLLETDPQAQFLAPMAVSLGFGVMAATVITLVIVPVCYHILHDVKGRAHQLGELAGFLDSQAEKQAKKEFDEKAEQAAKKQD
jgi:multidrug efflux pump subunit AcrB